MKETESHSNPMSLTQEQQKLAAHLWAVTNFCMARKGKAMPWAKELTLLFRYVAHCFYHGKLNVVFTDKEVLAVAFYWPDFQERIEAKFAEGLPQFEWLPCHKGDSLFIADVLGNREAIARLYRVTMERFPHLMSVPFFTYRGGKLVQLDRWRLERFARKVKI